jgi:hypothetical protein
MRRIVAGVVLILKEYYPIKKITLVAGKDSKIKATLALASGEMARN